MSQKTKAALVGFLITLLVIGGLAFVIWRFVLPQIREFTIFQPFRSSVDFENFHERFNLDPDVPQLVVDSQRLRDIAPPLVENRGGDASVFLRADFLHEYVDPFLFWDERAGVFFASTRYEMLEFTPHVPRFLINEFPHQLDTPIRLINGAVYLPADLIHQLYQINIEYFAEYNMVVVTSAAEAQTTAEVVVNHAYVRYNNNRGSAVTAALERGDRLTVFPDYGEIDGFVRVRIANGLLGYILRSDLGTFSNTVPTFNRTPLLQSGWVNNLEHHPPNWPEGVGINMVWDVTYSQDGNAARMNLPLGHGLTVVSPTWFRINEDATFFSTIASQAYVNWAHEQGVMVWPKVFDVNSQRVQAFLTNREARRTAINQLLHYVDILGLDGINIDFEHLNPPDGPYKIQFLRELALPLRERGVVLSAAVLIPLPGTMFYRRDLIALTVDFVQVMTYDEHWATSPIAGPNASLPWVQWSVENILREVPARQLILGLPFYNRVWRIVQSDGSVTQRALGMNYARNFFEERDVVWAWDSEIASYFGEVAAVEDGVSIVYRVWLEDERSIRAKMQIFVQHNLAGVAGWQRGLESLEAWNVISHYF